MHAERHTVTLTTDADGDAEGYTPAVTGRVLAIHYVKPGSGGFADGVDFDITAEATGEELWDEDDVNASATRAPRQPIHGADGAASLFAGAGEAVRDHIAIARDRVKIVVANGGDTKTGTFHVIIG